MTAELKKHGDTYYRRTGYRGECELPYFREEVMADRLGLPPAVVAVVRIGRQDRRGRPRLRRVRAGGAKDREPRARATQS